MITATFTSSKPTTSFASKLRTVTSEAWAFIGILCPLVFLTNAIGLDGISVGLFLATGIVTTVAAIGTFALGIRSLIVD
jgi:hypothetical protein